MRKKYKIAFLLCVMGYLTCMWSCKSERKISDNADMLTNMIDSLFTIDSSYILLTVGRSDCDVCQLISESEYYKNLSLGKAYINILATEENKMLSQALHTKAFPTNYIIDQNYNVVGIIPGMPDFDKIADSVLIYHQRVYKDSFMEMDKDSVPPMLSYSLKSLISYWRGDMLEMKKYAQMSVDKQSYFFNNYLLYLVYLNEGKANSASFYKNVALQKHSSGVNMYIYDNLIAKLKKER